MLRAIMLATGDLADRRMLAILARSLLVTLSLFGVAGAAALWLLRGADPCDALGLDACPLGTAASGVGATVITVLALWFLFPAVALGVIAGFADDAIAAVEARHYPAAAAGARRLGHARSAGFGLVNAGRILLYNLLASPLYVVLLVTGVGTAVLFVLVNGVACAADLGAMVAARHGDPAARRAWLRASRSARRGIGIATAAMLLVPFLNLLAPLVGAAAMTHLHHLRRTSSRA